MSVYTDLETAVLELLKASSGLVDVKTFEADIRECLFAEVALTKGFRQEELPAVNVTAQLEPSRTVSITAGEVEMAVPITVVVVTRSQRKKEARTKAQGLAAAVETALNAARKSDNGLGQNAIVSGDVATTIAVVDDKPLHFGIAQVEAQILKVVQL